jgi:hypothetical protein
MISKINPLGESSVYKCPGQFCIFCACVTKMWCFGVGWARLSISSMKQDIMEGYLVPILVFQYSSVTRRFPPQCYGNPPSRKSILHERVYYDSY